MNLAADPAALVAHVRAALRFDAARATHAAVRARGAGTVGGLPATVTWQCHVDGRSRLDIASALPGSIGLRIEDKTAKTESPATRVRGVFKSLRF